MTWPFENDTSAIVKKLAGRSMQADKRNKAFLLLTIAISVCMVFSILLISTGTQEKFKNTQRNKAQIGILGVTDEQTAQLHQNENITWVGEYSAIGVFYVENKTITVAYGNEDYFLHQEEKTFQGSVPQKADEIMLPQNYLDFLGKSYQTGDTISIDLTGTGQKAEYTLSGVLNNTKESNGYFIYVSKELAQDLAKDSFQVTAYTRLNTDAISSTAILNFAGKAIQNTGIVEEQVMLTEYSAVMSGVITSGIPIPVPLLAALTAILAATIVYGVFYTKIVKNVQMFGQLRTVGMTKRQIKRMASKEGRLYALAGIPLGLVIGVLIGFIGCPDGFRLKTTVIYAVLIAAVAFVTVNIAIFKPVRVAMNTSPVEGAKYLAYAGKAKSSSKLHRKLTPFNLAKINIQRNKQKAVLTLLMLGVSGALLLVTSTVAGSIDPAKQASFKYYPAGNILIQIRNTVGSSFDNEAEPYGSAKLQLEENPLEDQALMQELEKVDNCGFYKVLAYTGQPKLLDTLAGSIQEILQEKADITTSDALYQQMKAPLTQITRVVALMRLLTFFTGTMIVSLLLCMWMRSRQKEMAVLISMGEQKHIILLQALLEAAIVFLIALVFACGFGTLTASWLQNLLFSSVETGASLEVSLQLTDVALLLGIGSGVVVIAVLLSLLPVIRANPKDILSRMEG